MKHSIAGDVGDHADLAGSHCFDLANAPGEYQPLSSSHLLSRQDRIKAVDFSFQKLHRSFHGKVHRAWLPDQKQGGKRVLNIAGAVAAVLLSTQSFSNFAVP